MAVTKRRKPKRRAREVVSVDQTWRVATGSVALWPPPPAVIPFVTAAEITLAEAYNPDTREAARVIRDAVALIRRELAR